MPRVGFEPTISAFELTNTVNASGLAATVIGLLFVIPVFTIQVTKLVQFTWYYIFAKIPP
jgi:hypothetical protein